MPAADLPGETAPAQRAPHQRTYTLIDAQRHQLLLVVAADRGIVDLVADVACPAIPLRNGQRLHQMPPGEVGAGDITLLAVAHQGVKRVERLLNRSAGVEAVQVIDVDIVRSQALETGF